LADAGASAVVVDVAADPVCVERLGSERGQNTHSAMPSTSAIASDGIPGRMAMGNLALELGSSTAGAPPRGVSPQTFRISTAGPLNRLSTRGIRLALISPPRMLSWRSR
jgi:hypothetical protein